MIIGTRYRPRIAEAPSAPLAAGSLADGLLATQRPDGGQDLHRNQRSRQYSLLTHLSVGGCVGQDTCMLIGPVLWDRPGSARVDRAGKAWNAI